MMKYKMLMDAYSLFQSSNSVICQNTLFPGQRISPHWHDYFEYEIILSGHTRHIYNGEVYEMSRGYTYLLSYCDYHSFHALDEVGILNIRFRENLLNSSIVKYITQKPNKLICELDETETEKTAAAVLRLGDESANPQVFSDIVKVGIISELIIALIRNFSNDAPEVMPQIIQLAAAYINTNFSNNITLEFAAHELSLSPNYPGTLFKKYMGTSFNEYLNNTRLKYA